VLKLWLRIVLALRGACAVVVSTLSLFVECFSRSAASSRSNYTLIQLALEYLGRQVIRSREEPEARATIISLWQLINHDSPRSIKAPVIFLLFRPTANMIIETIPLDIAQRRQVLFELNEAVTLSPEEYEEIKPWVPNWCKYQKGKS